MEPSLKSETGQSEAKRLRTPKLSVVLLTSDNYASLRRTVGYLKQQTIQNQVELIIVAPVRSGLVSELALIPGELVGFINYQIVEIGALQSIGHAYAAGIRAARSPIVALGEDHCFPAAGWAEALVQAHQQNYAAVGPALCNANPNSAISWADMLIAYMPWLDPVPAQTVNFLPGHNSSYKRDILLQYGDRLEEMMESETLMHWDLRSQGHELYLESSAKAAHMSFAQMFPWLPVQFRTGRVFAGGRAEVENWSWLKRLAYVVASPLIPIVRWVRILRALNQSDRKQIKLATGTLPVALLGLVIDGLGQMVGYGFGYGNSLQIHVQSEFHRERYLANSAEKTS